ncbi:MAG: hypothetical protein PWQ96_2372 [Clostridia bacterium]|nr:hypothetical protein [Clostridia bacterium]
MAKKLYVSFLWHMHQPYYRKSKNGTTLMPWVRLHGIKGYYDMPKLIENLSGIKVNFNIVPSLLEQITEYTNGKTDDYLRLSRIAAEDLTKRQQEFIINNFFQAYPETMINPYPRYRKLSDKNPQEFTTQDLLDLQVWFNLTWFGQWLKDNHPFIQEMLKKGRNFTEYEKQQILDLQINVLGEVKELYRALQQNKKIEISTTPFYHPILPLLINSDIARKCMSDAALPVPAFKYEEDARWHVEEAINYHYQTFNKKPRGVWPAEGAVSDAALKLLIENNLKWTASDEDILRHSLKEWDEDSLYQPYLYKSDDGEIALVFRNHGLSDLIGFVYQNWKTEDAVGDFINHLKNIKNIIKNDVGLVSIIMDGENAWEYYLRNGWDFLRLLYESIVKDDELQLTTINDYLEEYPPQKKLTSIYPGSWIYANYSTWIGDPIKNKAWKQLLKVREMTGEKKCEIPRNMYIAQGSDWFWWYGEPHTSVNDPLFDELFRSNLIETCEEIGVNPPCELNNSLYEEEKSEAEPSGIINPEINGKEDDYHEWLQGVSFKTVKGYGAMHRVSKIITNFTYGFDSNNLYLRWDYSGKEKLENLKLQVLFNVGGSNKTLEIDFGTGEGHLSDQTGKKYPLRQSKQWELAEILEIMVPLEYLDDNRFTAPLELRWMITGKEGTLEEWPYNKYLKLQKPRELLN